MDLGKLKNTSNFRCYLMFDRSDALTERQSQWPSREVYVSQFGWSAVSPSRPARSQSASRSGRQGKRAAARSHAQPPLCGEHGEHGEHWTLMAAATGVTLDQAGCELPLPLPTIPTAIGKRKREAHQKARPQLHQLARSCSPACSQAASTASANSKRYGWSETFNGPPVP
jgi:hypothetical protein